MPKIDKMFAYIAEDQGPDDEGIMAIQMPDGIWMPLVGADMARIKSLQGFAEEIKRVTGKPYRVIEFSTRRDITKEIS